MAAAPGATAKAEDHGPRGGGASCLGGLRLANHRGVGDNYRRTEAAFTLYAFLSLTSLALIIAPNFVLTLDQSPAILIAPIR